MGPDWYFDAYEACEELYDQAHAANAGPAWDQLTDEQKHKAVMDFVRQCADIARAVQKESDV